MMRNSIFGVALLAAVVLLFADRSSAADAVLNDAVVFAKPTLVTAGSASVRRGLNAIVPNFNWRYRNVTELYVGSVEAEALYKFGEPNNGTCARAEQNARSVEIFLVFFSTELLFICIFDDACNNARRRARASADLASGELTKLATVDGGVSALAWKSRLANGQSLENVGNALYYASPRTGRVYTIERSSAQSAR